MTENERLAIKWLKERFKFINTPREDEFTYLDEYGEWVSFSPCEIHKRVEFINEFGRTIGPTYNHVSVNGLKQEMYKRPVYLVDTDMLRLLSIGRDVKKVLSMGEKLKQSA